MSQTRNPSQVKRRRVFYIPGYDPIHPRRYRELYRTESTAQAAISNYEIGQTEVVLDFRPVCSLVKMDQGFI